MKSSVPQSDTLLRLWIWLAAGLNLTGWTLSALHQLNLAGYCFALIFLAGTVWHWRSALRLAPVRRFRLERMGRRFRRPLPAIFFGLAALSLLGGLLWAPTNYDALTYRLPRVLNWLAAGHWFWIPAINGRLNFSGLGAEWLTAPLLVLTQSDRALFLLNFFSFGLLPGLLFSVFRRLGVRGRVAWVWMWLLPCGYGYVMQAGGLGNDLLGAVFALAAVHFGLRARTSGGVQDVWLSLLAIALLTGLKLTNLPLALPGVVAVWPALPLLRRRLVSSVAVLGLAAAASALPIMAVNRCWTGSAGGDPKNFYQAQISNPAAALLGNGLQLAQSSLLPPVLPGAPQWFDRVNQFLPATAHDWLKTYFPRYYLGGFSELPSEEGAGLGFGISVTLLILLLATLMRPGQWRRPVWSAANPIIAAAWIALLFYLGKIGSEATARLLLPYYPLALVPLLRLPLQERWLRSPLWRLWLALAALSILPAIILSPSRPLWPAETISQAWLKKNPDSQLARRFAVTYATYAHRNDLLRPLREHIPAEARLIGLAAGSNDTEYSLWRPFGERVVRCIWLGRERQEPVIPAGIEWLVVHVKEWNYLSATPLPEWAARHHARIVATVPIVTFAKHGADDWCVLQLEKPADAGVIPPSK